MDKFQKELGYLLNLHCIENKCDVPDFLLAEMIVTFIQDIGILMKKTLDWHGCDSVCHPAPNQPLGSGIKSSVESDAVYCAGCGFTHSSR